MTAAKFTHLLVKNTAVSERDVWATHLAMSSKGRLILKGSMCGRSRELLARELGEDSLAELLRSGRPIRVAEVEDGYRFEEME